MNVPPIFRRKPNGKACRNAATWKALPARDADGKLCGCCVCRVAVTCDFEGVETHEGVTVDGVTVYGEFVNGHANLSGGGGQSIYGCSYSASALNYPLKTVVSPGNPLNPAPFGSAASTCTLFITLSPIDVEGVPSWEFKASTVSTVIVFKSVFPASEWDGSEKTIDNEISSGLFSGGSVTIQCSTVPEASIEYTPIEDEECSCGPYKHTIAYVQADVVCAIESCSTPGNPQPGTFNKAPDANIAATLEFCVPIELIMLRSRSERSMI